MTTLTSAARRARHVPASRVDDKTLLPCTNLEWMPPGPISWLEANQVLIPELSEQILNRDGGMRRRAGDAHVPSSPACKIRECGGLCGPAVTRDFELGAGTVSYTHLRAHE